MKKTVAAAIALTVLASSPPAFAGIYGDDLARCIVKSATDRDQTTLVRWVFAAMAAHDAVKPLVSVSPEQATELNKGGAALLQRLLLDDCHKETVAAVKYEGPSAIEGGFNVLGQVAMRNLMADPKVQANLAAMNSYIDVDRFNALANEAGVPSPPRK